MASATESPLAAPASSRDLLLQAASDNAAAIKVFRALASEPRLRILELLSDQLLNASEIAQKLSLPLTTATMHLKILEDAQLTVSERKPATRGSQKVCARAVDTLHVRLPHRRSSAPDVLELSMPIGAYTDLKVFPTCGLAGCEGVIGLLDDPASFYEPERLGAQLLWFRHGYVEYRFPNRTVTGAKVESVQLSLELCSEAPLHHDSWPSDITVWVNGVELGSWTSPADFGGQRGALTPAWWEPRNSQYGLLKVWQTDREGSFIDGLKLSEVRVEDLALDRQSLITVRIGVKESAKHVGGLNLFGRSFGNYPQDIILGISYL